MKIKDELIKYLDAGYPMLYINSFEEIKTDKIIKSAVGGRKIYEWNGAYGLCDFYTKTPCFQKHMDLVSTLELLSEGNELERKLLVLKDSVSYFEDSHVIALLKNICHSIEKGVDTGIIIVSSVIKIPVELEKYVTILEMEYLAKDEIVKQIEEFVKDQEMTISQSLLEKMTIAFKGLSEYEIDNLLASAISEYGDFTEECLGLILEQKRQMIKKSNILDMVMVNENADNIGGLDVLKSWLSKKAVIFQTVNKAVDYGVDMPKGVLICGIPGCGKSLTAKVTASMFKIPLLRLDIGRIMGMYVGESEANLRNAISLAEAVSPCVLWVDELEKAFAGVNGFGHEVTIRMFGTLLTWMQEKNTPVFVVATANDISQLPAELLRKGRFDDIFYVDLPDLEERKSIIDIHIKKRRPLDISKINTQALAERTKGFSGADLESVVVEAIEMAYVSKMPCLQDQVFEKVIASSKSISDIMKKNIDKVRDFYVDNNFKRASLKKGAVSPWMK